MEMIRPARWATKIVWSMVMVLLLTSCGQGQFREVDPAETLPIGLVQPAPTAAPATVTPPPATATPVVQATSTTSPRPAAAPSTAAPPTVQPPTAVPPTAVPPTVAAPPVLQASTPHRVRIPRLGIDAMVEQVGLDSDGAMDVPKSYETVGWYKLGPRPGMRGNAVIAGHLDSKTGPAVFWRLRELRPGDSILVIGADGVEHRFTVRVMENYPYNNAPLERIFGSTDQISLNLITCGGIFDRGSQNYDKRLVVYTTLA